MNKAHDKRPVYFAVKVQADASGNLPTEIELFRTGSWQTGWHGNFDITIEDIDETVRNFEAGVYRVQGTEPLPGTLDHLGGGSPAAFRIQKVYRTDESLMGSVTWTALGQEKLERDEYRYISSEFNPRAYPFENPEDSSDFMPNVLTGATLTNDPLFKDLKPVFASARTGGRDKQSKGEPMDLATLRAKKPDELTDDEKKFVAEHAAELTAEERKTFDVQTEADKEAEAKADADAKEAAEKEAADKAAAEAKAAEEAKNVEASAKGGVVSISKTELEGLKASAARADALAQEIATDKARTFVAAAVKDGRIKSGESDNTVKLLLASAGSQRTALEAFITGLPKNESLGKELGDGGLEASADALADIDSKTRAVLASARETGKKMSYATARKQVLADNPSLKEQLKEVQ